MSDTQLLAQQNGQREHAKARVERATKDVLSRKRRATDEFTATLETDDGPIEVSFKLRALGPSRYDDLAQSHQPTEAQRKRNPQLNINPDTWPAALLSEVCVEPRMSAEEWREAVFANEDWGMAERRDLHLRAESVCQRQLDLGPFVDA